MTTLFLVIAAGYLFGEVNVKGFRARLGAVLFVGLASAPFAPNSYAARNCSHPRPAPLPLLRRHQYRGYWSRGLTAPRD